MERSIDDGTEAVKRGRQITLDFSGAATEELERLEAATGCTVGQMVHGGMTLMRQVVEARQQGLTEVAVIDGPDSEPPLTQKLLF